MEIGHALQRSHSKALGLTTKEPPPSTLNPQPTAHTPHNPTSHRPHPILHAHASSSQDPQATQGRRCVRKEGRKEGTRQQSPAVVVPVTATCVVHHLRGMDHDAAVEAGMRDAGARVGWGVLLFLRLSGLRGLWMGNGGVTTVLTADKRRVVGFDGGDYSLWRLCLGSWLIWRRRRDRMVGRPSSLDEASVLLKVGPDLD